MMDEIVIIITVLLLVLLGFYIAATSDTYILGQHAEKILTECEATLPRDEICFLAAKGVTK